MKMWASILRVTHFAALSNVEFIDHTRYFRHAEKKLAKAQQALSRKKHGSHGRWKAARLVAKCHRKIANQRRDSHHKAARKRINRCQVFGFEDLQVYNLTKAPTPKQDENGKYLPNGAAAKAGLSKRSSTQEDLRGTMALLPLRVRTGPGYGVCESHL